MEAFTPAARRFAASAAAMTKPLCELKKSLKGDLHAYMKLVRVPTHVCRKCGRVANCKKLLCKPLKLPAE